MIFSFQVWKTVTMIFLSSEELIKFLQHFEESHAFINLIRNKPFQIKIEDDIISFYFKHKDRNDYSLFTEQLEKTKIKSFFNSLGWQILKLGSGEKNATSQQS
jgi:hypothetical protein